LQKILITGANGFLGSYITKELLDLPEASISILLRTSSDSTILDSVRERITIVEGDVTDVLSLERAFNDIELIVHCAAVVSYNSSDRAHMQKVNVEGTANVVNVAIQCGVKKLVFISSTAALGRRKITEVINEKVKWIRSPLNTEYAISKYKSEQEVWRGQAEGLNIAILNPSLILGSGDYSKTSLKVVNHIARGLPFYPTGQVGIVDVRDVAYAVKIVIEKNINGVRVILCAENWSYKDFFSYVATKLGVSPPKYPLSPFIGKTFISFEKLRSVFANKKQTLSSDNLKSTSVRPNYSNELSKSLLGLEYRSVKDTIDDMLSDYKSNQKTF
jgi:nucleoside-diphosphate-sugar epimerase